MPETGLKHLIFEYVRRRLTEASRTDTLQRFYARWEGKASGIEGWFKVEFVAAIDPTVARIKTGGGGGPGHAGKKYCDLILIHN